MLAVIVEEQGLGAALALVVAAADADRVDLAPVALRLRMHFRIAVDFAGRGLQDARLDPLGQAQHVDGAVHAGFGGLHRVVLVVHRAGRAGQVENAVHLDVQREGDVVAHQLEIRLVQQLQQVVLAAGEVVVDAQHVVAAPDQAVAQVRAEETRTAGHQHFSHAAAAPLLQPTFGRCWFDGSLA